MRLAINLVLSAAMLTLFMWLVWPDHLTREKLSFAIGLLDLATMAPYLAAYVALLVIMHLCRSLRWNNLLAPLGIRVPAGPLVAISSVGFMAILALPARLGEFVRPGLMRKRGVSASAALGTVAVERIVDGLLISLFVFGAFFSLRGPDSPRWMMPTAYAALGVFGAALVSLIFAMRWPVKTVRFGLALSLLPKLSPRIAGVIEAKLLDMIRGFDVLRDKKNLSIFVGWSLVYWGANGLGLWVLARGFGPVFDWAHLPPLTVLGAFASMGLVAVGITLPNSPGMVGQFQWFMQLGVSLYLGGAVLVKDSDPYVAVYAFASAHYVLQVIWYIAMGAIALSTPWVSFHDLWTARAKPAGDATAEKTGEPVAE